MTTKLLYRKIRVLRLLAVVQAYHHYTMMQLNRQLLQCDNNWQDAEHLNNWSKVFMPWKESSPTDFLHDEDEVSDEVLNNYDEFKKCIKSALFQKQNFKILLSNIRCLQGSLNRRILQDLEKRFWRLKRVF